MDTKNDDLLITFAKKLKDRQIHSNVIIELLSTICRHFSFSSSAIYEMDQFKYFHLKEHFGCDDTAIIKSFPVDGIHTTLLTKDIVYIKSNNMSSTIEVDLCNLFSTNSLILYPIVDNTKQCIGLLVLLNQQSHTCLSKEKLDTLILLLSILSRYIEPRMYENKISFAISSLESILDNTGIDIYVNDFNNHDILYVNKSMAAPYGGIEKFMGHKCFKVLYPGQEEPCEFCPQKKLTDEEGAPTKVYSWDYQRPFDNSWFRVFSAAFRWVDGRLAHVVSSADITDNKNYEALIHHMANYDSLTNLPNRRMLLEECEKRINKATKKEKGYILFFDIDNFKNINDTYGHDAGDEFLIQISRFFSSIPILNDAIYRNGGDEFIAIIGSEEITKDHIRELANTIHERFKRPWKLEKGDIFSNTSIGVACYPDDGTTADELIHKADLAMYKAKKLGGATICFGFEL